jgi:hypothetical protein
MAPKPSKITARISRLRENTRLSAARTAASDPSAKRARARSSCVKA